MQMREVTDLIRHHRTTRATGRGPALHVGRKHEMVKKQLAPSLEQILQRRLSLRPVEAIILLDPHHRQATPLRRERVALGDLLDSADQALGDLARRW